MPLKLRSLLPTYHVQLLRFSKTIMQDLLQKTSLRQKCLEKKIGLNICWRLFRTKTLSILFRISVWYLFSCLFICSFLKGEIKRKSHIFSYLQTSRNTHRLRDLWLCIFTVSKKAIFKSGRATFGSSDLLKLPSVLIFKNVHYEANTFEMWKKLSFAFHFI